MLTQIDITHLITIPQLSLTILPGSTALTGETGAGKSILIDAIELALGARVNANVVRPGAEKADICLCFDISQLPRAKEWLIEAGLEDGNDCIIRRTLFKDNRSRSFINGTPSTLQPLRELTPLLINIQGQHDNYGLLHSDTQRMLLDRYAGHTADVERVRHIAQQWQQATVELTQFKQATQAAFARSDFLRFQLNELETLNLTENELQSLDVEHKQLANADTILQQLHLALGCLTNEGALPLSSLINQAKNNLMHAQSMSPTLTPLIESLTEASILLTDTEHELRRFIDRREHNPERLQWLEQRLGLLYDMGRKHKVAPAELYACQQKISAELMQLENSDKQVATLENHLALLVTQYRDATIQLSNSRKKFAHKLEKEITTIIQQLSLPHAEFTIDFETLADSTLPSYGLEKITFTLKTNAGQPKQSLAKIISGGELSRISLAIQIATAEQQGTPTLIFDEVDVGIGGGTAAIIGKLLRQLGNTHQLLCITHLPQVAAYCQHHILVSKTQHNDQTTTSVKALTATEKQQEIARMLGGTTITPKTIAHAQEMLDTANAEN